MQLTKRFLVDNMALLGRMEAHLSPLRGLMNLPFHVPWADAQGYTLVAAPRLRSELQNYKVSLCGFVLGTQYNCYGIAAESDDDSSSSLDF
jgi:hypothetical protein